MSLPRPGTYHIINRVNSSTGDRLTITFNGQGNPLTVTPLTLADNQKFIIQDFDGQNFAFVPYTAQTLQCSLPSNVVTPLPAHDYVFWARVGPNGLYIQGGTGSVPSWEIASATTGSQVIFGDGKGNEKSFWALQVALV